MFPILSNVESRIFAMAYKALCIVPFTACLLPHSSPPATRDSLLLLKNVRHAPALGSLTLLFPLLGMFLLRRLQGSSLHFIQVSAQKINSESPSTIPYKIGIVIPLNHSNSLPCFYFSLWHLASLSSI